MSVRRKLQTEFEIDVGSFADIAFLLIIFFILTTSFVHFTGRAVDIPSSDRPDEAREEHKAMTIALAGDEIRFGADEDLSAVSMDELRIRLREERFSERETSRDRMVILDAAADVEWDRYFKVMTAVSHAGGIVAIVQSNE